MPVRSHSGQPPFAFTARPDLHTLPPDARDHEVDLHGGFAIDTRPDRGHIYYGMPGCGLIRVDPDLRRQQFITLPAELQPLTFHSTRLGLLDGQWRLFLPANKDAMVAVVNLDGNLDFVLPRPELEAYSAADTPFKPTDAVLVGSRLYVADGYGANNVSIADLATRQWTGFFGGKTADPQDNGKFGTAHGIRLSPSGNHLVIADRPHSRFQVHDLDGRYHTTRRVPAGAWPCGIDFIELDGRRLAVTGCLQDPVDGRPAPIYILDGETYEVLSTIRPKEELGVEPAQHLHNVVWHQYGGQLYLLCQSWNPGHYFVMERV